MCDPVTLMAGASLMSAGYSVYQGEKTQKINANARKEAKVAADATAQAAEEAQNKAGAKMPSIESILAAGVRNGGAASTMVTGPGGVDPSKLRLGRTTLLGG